MTSASAERTYIQVPTPQPVSRFRRWIWLSKCALLTPFYWLLAHRERVPGLGFHLKCALLGLRLLVAPKSAIRLGSIHNLMFLPIDSTRYFEFDFMWQRLSRSQVKTYLDVSSPRWFPLVFLCAHPHTSATLVNPDTRDLAMTARFVEAAGLGHRCTLESYLIGTAPFAPQSFDAVTCISVLEHIPQDRRAVQRLWEWLKPGGRLLISVPCAAKTSEQYINRNEYGLLQPDETGYVFWQRFYDGSLLQERIFDVTGPPNYIKVYGEKVPGTFQKNAEQKRAQPDGYPYWREPYRMGSEYSYYATLPSLPGEGVIGMEFIKQ